MICGLSPTTWIAASPSRTEPLQRQIAIKRANPGIHTVRYTGVIRHEI